MDDLPKEVDDRPNATNSFFVEGISPLTDGREESILAPRDQGDSNCCYGFVANDAMYAAQFMNEGELEKGSDQDFLDNLQDYYPPRNAEFVNGKCVVGPNGVGNRVANAFEYAMTQGLALEVDWPFVGTCRHTESDRELYETLKRTGRRIFLTGYHEIADDDHESVVNILRTQPVAASVPSAKSLRFWVPSMGVYQGPTEEEVEKYRIARENRSALPYGSHAILLIGFGEDSNGCAYYIAKNSLGVNWGFRGYVKIARAVCRRFVYPQGYKILDMGERMREKERRKEKKEKEKEKAKKQQKRGKSH